MRPTPKFSDRQRKNLQLLGATEPQITELEKRLPIIAELLRAKVPATDVCKVLREAKHAAATLCRIAEEAEKGSPQHREAIGHLGIAAASLELEAELEGQLDLGTVPTMPRFTELARLLHRITELAMKDAPRQQRRGRLDPGRAVQILLDALAVPQDEESQCFASKVWPIYAERSTRNHFPELARIVFTAATGDDPIPRAIVDAWKRRCEKRRCEARKKRHVPLKPSVQTAAQDLKAARKLMSGGVRR